MAPLSSIRKNRNGEWTETCIGIWSKSVRSIDKLPEQKPPLCVGINLVQVKVSITYSVNMHESLPVSCKREIIKFWNNQSRENT